MLLPRTALLTDPPPLVLTLAPEAEAQAYFEALRCEHFPAALNRVPAHLSLFHALPGREEQSVLATMREISRQAPMLVATTGLMKLGRGVAFRVEGERLTSLHSKLQQQWWPWLSAQDRQGFRPHIVIQNRAEPGEARRLHDQLSRAFEPFSFAATGLSLWRYLGGPWQPVAAVPFAAEDDEKLVTA